MTQRKAMPFTEQEIIDAVDGHPEKLSKAAKALTLMGRGNVTVQLLRAWIERFDHSDLGDAYNQAQTLKKVRTAQATASQLRRDNRALADALGGKQAFVDALEQVIEDLSDSRPVAFPTFPTEGKPMTVELLLSDLQIGKLSPGYNTEVARKRLYEYARAAIFQIKQKIDAGYVVERIILGLLGDIIESDRKHDNSGKATDSTSAEQIYDAVKNIFELVVEPLAGLGIPMDVQAITGNHDWDGHGLNMFEPGKSQFSWPLYKTMAMLTDRCGYKHVTWHIPEGSYGTLEIYGQIALYEHGVGVANTEIAMKAHKTKRSEQEKRYITYFRMGDKHTVTSFNSGQLVVNGAFFGADAGGLEYSGIAGYSSVPAQWMGFHVPRKTPKLMTLYDSFNIQLGGITE